METTTDDHNLSLRVASFAYYLDTAKENMVHRAAISAHQETPETNSSSPTIKPPLSIKFSKPNKDQSPLLLDSLKNLRVDSFSYNLNDNKGDNNNNFVFQIPGGHTQDPTSGFTFSHESTPKLDNGEIGVFSADKYFNMRLEYFKSTDTHQPKTIHNNKNRDEGNHDHIPQVGVIKSNTGPTRTPSLSSEASTWNSQTALLPGDLNRIGSQSKQTKRAISRKRISFTGFGCRGSCFDKKSVHTNEIVADGSYCISKAPTRIGSERIETKNIPAVMIKKVEQDLDESRPSIEVFGSSKVAHHHDHHDDRADRVATNMERKLSMLTWDAIPKSNGQLTTAPSSTTNVGSTICDDMASEASSDLFEIENISGSIYPILTSEKQVLPDDVDLVSGFNMSPTSNYAPSEASIQWSIVTASAADYSSALSDYYCNDESSVSVAGSRGPKTRNGIGPKEAAGQKAPRGGGLLGCKSYKAVEVAENHVKKVNDHQKLAKNDQLLR